MGIREWPSAIRNAAKVLFGQPTTSRIIYTGRTPAGVYVDADTALKNATVWACIQYLTRAVGQLPWRVMRELPGGGSETVATNPVDYLLHQRPCPDVGSFAWRQSMLSAALRYGNAYAEIQRDNRGAAYALWPIHPDRVVVRRGAGGLLEYDVWNQAGQATLAAADMFHVRGLGDGPVGYSVIQYAAQSIGWAQATEVFGSTFFGEGANPSGIVTVPATTKLGLPGLETLRKEMKRLYSGPKGERTMILDAGMEFQRLSGELEASQFIETRQHQVEEICRWFGVPPHKVQHLLRSTFSNIEHQSIEVVIDSVTPWVKAFEEEANYKLFGINRQGLFTKMNLRGLLRGDNASRSQFYKTMAELGMTINQILNAEDLPGIGPKGDTVFVSNNVQTLEQAIRGKPAPSPAPAPAAPDEVTDEEQDGDRRLPN